MAESKDQKKPTRREEVAELRKQGLTQQQVADKLGISRACVSKYEKRSKRFG